MRKELCKNIKNMKNNLKISINTISKNIINYVKDPDKDFTRKSKLNAKELITFILNMSPYSLNKELKDFLLILK